VDYAGQPCDIKTIREIADEFDIYLIEDACHAIGAEYRGKKVGNFADLTIFSFHPVKNITTGEGGAVVMDDKDLYDKLLLLRSHGIDRDAQDRYGPDASWAYDMKYLGRNYRMTDFQAALGISQLKKLEGFIQKRNNIASIYSDYLGKISFIKPPIVKKNIRHAWHLYTILLDSLINRENFFKYMRTENIGVNVHYIPVYRHSYYINKFRITPKDFPNTENVFERIITLPLYPKMKDEDVIYVCNKISNFSG
jgi:dTDP-4-amino-4,6-dideoxygalactose transaminase